MTPDKIPAEAAAFLASLRAAMDKALMPKVSGEQR
jgi:hypothetical protein